ncbi:MAG: amidase [Desulfobacterales bacterium]|nr:MAG: amidase [Desulfobacterales bacterium]
MNLAEYARLDGLGLAELIRKKGVTSREVAELALAGVEKINPKINAVIEIYPDRVENAGTLPLSGRVFSGVPLFLKDLGATEAGRRQEMGSRLTRGYVADTEAYLTTCFKEAGTLILGRTATPELGFAATTESILTGATRNPWDLNLIAGGSSGGSAAAVAAGIVPAAHASDGGGSIRIPAACCGVIGLKPSRGRVSCGPAADERLFGLVQEFVVSRTVRDTAAMLDAASRPAPGDPFMIVQHHQSFLEEVDNPAGKLRIAYTAESWTGVDVNPEIAAGVKHIARICEDMGHYVETAKPRIDLEQYFSALGVFWGASMHYACDQLAQKMDRPVDRHHLEPVTLKIYEDAGQFSAADVIRARAAVNLTRRKLGAFFERYDLLLSPTIAQLPVPVGTIDQNQDVPLEKWYEGTSQFNTFTNLFNATGLPAISLPLCQSSAGLPIGIQFGARFGEEDLLIRIASAFEKALPWANRKPPIHVGNS